SNAFMKRDKLKDMLDDILGMDSRNTLDLIISVKADRIHTLLPGMIILNRIASYFSVDRINVSRTGVREGYVYERIIKGE
ncbi:phosphatase, partial [Peptostreptococcus anaerobius]|nr:phosphatase [Peptostreptococcus anaerobius]MDB8828576.1 phosphatase [Peptostreptococcus anaerobius]MDB8846933.1 phosphatase [Peptostreptococcus anaerobius]MDB8854705.1 phosphatase [Peptostreptococcus anaerobius]